MEYQRSTGTSMDRQSFGRYKVLKLIGEGAMGRVYLAEDPVLDRKVAIKVIAIDKMPDDRTREEYLKRFSLEAKASAKLNHPSIVAIYDAGNEAGIPWIAFEYIDGEKLEDLIAPPELLPFEKILSITLDIASALHHAHECGIIHRDIKPANILIDRRTQIAKLSDFGVMKAPWVALTQDGTAVGSPGYMAPEQLDGSGTDARCDLFSLGIVLYQMITGKHPFLRNTIPATIFATLHSTFQPIEELRADTPPYLISIVSALLQSDRTKRIQSAAELLSSLRAGGRKTALECGEHTSSPFDKEALIGNTTRLRRISRTLQNLGRRGMRTVNIWTPYKPLMRIYYAFTGKTRTLYDRLLLRFKLPFSIKQHSSILAVLIFIVVTLVCILIAGIFAPSSSERMVLNELRKAGWRGGPQQLIDTCIFLLDEKRFPELNIIAPKLTRIRSIATQAYVILARAALLEGKDREVVEALTKAATGKDWRRIRKGALPMLLRDCSVRLSQNRADSSLIATLAWAVLSERKKTVTEWTRSQSYWLRWNSVKAASYLKLPVDSVEVYILDLQYAGSIRTRNRAATRLGELGDKRAVPYLKKIASLGLRDPIVSYTADLVLKNYFRDSSTVRE